MADQQIETETKGINLPCPLCGKEDPGMYLYLDSMEIFKCADCDEEISVDQVRAFCDKWQAVLKWLESAPRNPN